MEYFETIKCFDNGVFNLFYHEQRVAKTIGMNFNLQDYIYPPSNKLYRCKVIYDESGILDVNYFVYKKREIKSFKIVIDETIEYSKKRVNREELEKLFGKRELADEIIIVKNGIVTDTSIANIAIFDGSNWLTSKNCLLQGTTRARCLQEGFLIEKDITLQMLKDAKKIALMNAMIDFDVLEDYSFLL
ncbi:branched-chain amino acid aminotransferase [Halarcobacter ebronensis]|uniref:Branched-chain amino acid aminotransferase n=1 Tax=Halarcobacter ebronensis TaxID=1462615 RepID=A0A4Q0Y9P2_9BACT|nr:aminotransferase class IV family protein [Halarcobacter ebronensis]RXJ65461.1 branched-chain amino acid aminotransferase [Halarcobacter ebronensis]